MCQKLCHELNTHYLTYYNSSTKKMLLLSLDNETDSDCSREIKRCLLLGRKAMTNLDSILKRGDITLLMKVCIIKDMFFPVVMYGYESWAIKKA